MRYSIVAKGVEKAGGDIDRMGHQALNPEPAFQSIMDTLVDSEKVLFKRNGGGGKNRWPENTRSTQRTKAAKDQDTRPMRATGALEKSLTERHAADGIRTIKKDYMEFGTKLFYAQFSQFAKNPKRLRQVVKILPKQRKIVRETIASHLTKGFGD